jgi:uncharacterized protein
VQANGAGGSLVTVWVVPGASRAEVAGTYGDALKVRVPAPPEAGRANRAVEELLASVLGAVATVVRGPTTRRKTVEVPGLSPPQVAGLLDR